MPAHIAAVVVAYRSAAHLPDLLGDLAREGLDEIIVVDNASPDDSAALAAAAGAVVVTSDANHGFAHGVNLGVAATDADHLLVINPDVRIAPGAIGALLDATARHPGAIVGPRVHDLDGRVLPTRRSLPSLASLLGEEVLIPERAPIASWPQRAWARWRSYDEEGDAPTLSGVCLLVPRAAWLATGGLDERYFLYWEEVDFQVRARAAGHPTTLVPTAEITHARSTALGLRSPQRALHMARSTRLFTDQHLGRSAPLARALLAAGQWLRWLAWSLPGLRTRPDAGARRIQHAAYLRGLKAN